MAYMYVWVHTCQDTCVAARGLGMNLEESVLFSRCVDPGIKLRSSGLALTYWPETLSF